MKFPTPLLAIVALAATACSRAGSDERTVVWSTELPAGAVVHLRNGVGDIEVKRASGSAAQVSGSRSWRRGRASDIQFVVQNSGNDYYVCAMWRNSGKCGASGYRGRNVGGFLSMFSLFHRTTDATADLVAEIPANVTLDAKTSSGELSIDGMTAGVTARTINGDIKAVNVGGKINLGTTNGDLSLAAADRAELDGISLTTTNGAIRAELPANTEGAFDLSTVNGDVSSDFPLAALGKSPVGHHLQGQVGAAERTVKMRSTNGSVVVVRRGASATHE